MVTPTAISWLHWIPVLPLIAAVYHGLMIGIVRRSTPRWFVIGLSCGTVFLAFLASCAAFGALIGMPEDQRLLVDDVYTWIGSGVGDQVISANVAFALDPISALMILVVTGVGFLIHVYSIGYMDDDQRDDKGFQRFFCYLNLFTFSMLVLVLADNLPLMFLGWEGVGLCSYLLIGFWYSDSDNAYCGSKAFVVNRIGDFAFLLGLFALFAALSDAGTPTVTFREIEANFDKIVDATVTILGTQYRLVNVVGVCFFIGACGKSAQLPLYVWLPDAMAGPTPVSALIHAATMVTAGVYMVCRMSFLYAVAPEASAVVAWTGGLTAVFAATIAVTQTDIKKVLAYSTVSQLGYMFLAAGCGGYTAAMFHLGTHAFFKALLFLGAGAVILAMHHEQNIEKMGGLWKKLPRTKWVFLAGTLAIIGFPGFSGFFSKDEILVAVWVSDVPGHQWLYWMGFATAGITAFYMARLFFMVFLGKLRAAADVRGQIHEPGASVFYPLAVLAFLSIVGGIMGVPQIYGDWLSVGDSNSLASWLAPVLPEAAPHALEHSTEYLMALGTVGIAASGVLVALFLYVRNPDLPEKMAQLLSGLYKLVFNKYYVDEVYDALIVRPTVALSDTVLYQVIDTRVIDGVAINGSANAVRSLASGALKYLQSGLTQGYVFLMIVGAVAIVGWLLR
ncbi:MAG: NADH-quinone oxidoreductase subunit L [Deltaproteobacteria bacterium]|nr:MAG: NADH-quinone oxidoreductase subunit L [Deltaproteobacteria bacterium]